MNEKNKKTGKKYWLSLEQRGDTPEFRRQLLERYYDHRDERPAGLTRRNFLTLMGASLALASLSGCRRPVEKIIPYVTQPEEVTPGIPQYYATTMPRGNNSIGLLVQTREGRPIKIEGNPQHPSSQGATDFITQASLLNLYDPDRSKKIRQKGSEDNYDNFVSFWRELLTEFQSDKGRGLAVLSEAFASPTIARLKKNFLKAFPEARWVTYEPISDENIYKATDNLFKPGLRPAYRFEGADIILAVDSDFLQYESDNIIAARGFADGRRVNSPDDRMNRLYVVESNYSITGAMADHRLRLSSGQTGQFVVALARELKKQGLKLGDIPDTVKYDFDSRWLQVVAVDLLDARGKSLIVAGHRQPVWVHELVITLNMALENLTRTINFIPVKYTERPDRDDLVKLTAQMNEGGITTLILLGGNPVYNAPVDLNFKEALAKVAHTVHISSHVDETSLLTEWHIPRSHYLESWGDTEASDGTLSVSQPMIEPLLGGHPDIEFLALLSTGLDQRGYDLVRETWREILRGGDFEKKWRRVLHDGLLRDSSLKPAIATAIKANKPLEKIIQAAKDDTVLDETDNLEINFYPSNLYDGRFANNGWLQELPEAVTRLAWDNAALISPATAERLQVKNNEVVKLAYGDFSLEIPVWICPGNADNTIALPLGYGRTDVGRVGNGVGFNAYLLRTTVNQSFDSGVRLSKTGKNHPLANTQDHSHMEGRPIVREATLAEYRHNPEFAREAVEYPPLKSIYSDHDYSKGYQWGMVIDLNVCIGCNACTIACQSENNVQIVGREQVAKGREMHWLRNDRYFVGDIDNPGIVYQPVPCQQCENAPCEQVCPVAATVHDSEGLNNMVYNRCIGTRYCSNNCPYKVRRFNFFNYVNKLTEVEKMVQNPDVTVRSRGVMEKCTFCLQRLKAAKTKAKLEDRTVADGEIQTACQQVCPTKAIQFGNINDPASRVFKLKKADRNYELLAELNVRPRNSYLVKLRNPNPELENHKPKAG
ncbi:MAG: TAT-variant-translocated molybdopterin oxidoreductase [candidate division Zixibacteria bacterium]|nr:TAT-variant-translocated molybdopterin oxidoreductase [candidate division Zixibacteria bacterium]